VDGFILSWTGATKIIFWDNVW